MKKIIFTPLLIAWLFASSGCSGQLTTREKSAAIGTVSGWKYSRFAWGRGRDRQRNRFGSGRLYRRPNA